ncbi:synaptobrevin [Pleomassaria siparia CBS 279.74]|uniref:Synaptobrevin homolog YKT6 n=1 Tax=Pleomassaria siparia CBS 279.74 TaxID=1314801 RepID=A0A6G1KI58_9PLEO|nr:synaptobrevin [Pleomassaria siparia CBS 279.74]
MRGSIKEVMGVFIDRVAIKTRPGMRQTVEEKEDDKGFTIHAYGRTEGICGIIVSDKEYPSSVAHPILSKICDEFLTKYPRTAYANVTKQAAGATPPLTFPELKDYIVKYQDPQQADSIAKIQRELNDTKDVLHKTIESMLERGEKIDNLVAKSDGLSAQSKMFYTQAKKQNSCCLVM